MILSQRSSTSLIRSSLKIFMPKYISNSGRALSIATILLGSLYYTYAKHLESQKHQQLPSPMTKQRDGGVYERVPLEELEGGAMAERRPG